MLITLFEFSLTTEREMPQAFLYLSQTATTWQLHYSFHRPNSAQAATQGKLEVGTEKPLVLTETSYEDQPVSTQVCHTSVGVLLGPSKPGAEIPSGKQCPPRKSHLESCLGTSPLLLADET